MDTFFCSLLSLPGQPACTLDKLDSMPVDIDLQIIMAIVESEEGANFFMNALRLRNWIEGLSGRSSKKKTD